MKKLSMIFSSCASVFASVDMSNQSARAADLGLSVHDYVFLMSLSGVALGFIFGLFLWKVR